MKFSQSKAVSFREQLLKWYDANKRDLPWRKTKDPYAIWVSEIMLQQTRVAAVLDHYRRFMEKFPSVEALARAREQTVLASWSGLGYYRRARNMHAAAKVVSSEHAGLFPDNAEGLRALPGIGRYTASAIASIAFDKANSVVDGNVERVMARVTGNEKLSQQQTWNLVDALLGVKRPGDFNQAMMELGAMVCLPKAPKCLACPVMKYCATRGALPSQKKEVRKSQSLSVGLASNDGAVWLEQRPRSASLMPGMWELPEITPNGHAPLGRFKHSILQTDYDVVVYESIAPDNGGQWFRRTTLPKAALTGLTRKVLRHLRYLPV